MTHITNEEIEGLKAKAGNRGDVFGGLGPNECQKLFYTITQLRARAEAAEKERDDVLFLLSRDDSFFCSGPGVFIQYKDDLQSPITIYALYSHYGADAEEVPLKDVTLVVEACRKFGVNEAAMGWVLFRRNQDKLIKIKTTPEIIAARDWFRGRPTSDQQTEAKPNPTLPLIQGDQGMAET